MTNALPDEDVKSIAILDVLRGQIYDNDNCPLLGDEEAILSERLDVFSVSGNPKSASSARAEAVVGFPS